VWSLAEAGWRCQELTSKAGCGERRPWRPCWGSWKTVFFLLQGAPAPEGSRSLKDSSDARLLAGGRFSTSNAKHRTRRIAHNGVSKVAHPAQRTRLRASTTASRATSRTPVCLSSRQQLSCPYESSCDPKSRRLTATCAAPRSAVRTRHLAGVSSANRVGGPSICQDRRKRNRPSRALSFSTIATG
jgi:hypothetical protein